MHKANPWRADLQGADLGGAYLKKANLGHTDLRRADLGNANLQGAELSDARISSETELKGASWDHNYISTLERSAEPDYEVVIALYRRLKNWHEQAGLGKIAGEFHYREREAARKAARQRLGRDFRMFRMHLAEVWHRFRGKDASDLRGRS